VTRPIPGPAIREHSRFQTDSERQKSRRSAILMWYDVGFSNRSSPVNSILSVVSAGTMVLFVIAAEVRHIMACG
jgi:hypothetical protein